MLRSSSASLARLSRYTPLRSRWGAFAFVACALVAQASPAEAFCRNTTCKDTDKKTCLKDDKGCTTEGNALFWPTSCIEFHMNEQGTQFLDLRETRTAIMKAFRSWSAVDCGGGKQACNWITQDVLREINNRKLNWGEFPISAEVLTEILKQVIGKKITIKSGREVFMELLENVPAEKISVGEVGRTRRR